MTGKCESTRVREYESATALSGVLGVTLPFNALAQLRAALYGEYPHLARLGEVSGADAETIRILSRAAGRPPKVEFVSPVSDFYLTNPIARASTLMAECSQLAIGLKHAAE